MLPTIDAQTTFKASIPHASVDWLADENINTGFQMTPTLCLLTGVDAGLCC